jgi:hypothetical protein
MFADQPTRLLLANNSLAGPVPDAWSARFSVLYSGSPGGSWAALALTNNPAVCGPLPPWYSGLYGAAEVAAWTAGTAIGTTCPTLGASFYLAVSQQPLAQAGTPVVVSVVGNVSSAAFAGGWSAALLPPGAAAAIALGALALDAGSNGSAATWSLTVAGSTLTASGTYTLTVAASGTSDAAAGSPMAVLVNSADPAAGGSSLQVSTADARLGGSASIALLLKDAYGNDATLATGAALSVVGSVSKAVLAGHANFTKVSEGHFEAVYPFRAHRELLQLSLSVGGAAAGSASVNVSGVMPSAVGLAATVGGAVGLPARWGWGWARPGPAHSPSCSFTLGQHPPYCNCPMLTLVLLLLLPVACPPAVSAAADLWPACTRQRHKRHSGRASPLLGPAHPLHRARQDGRRRLQGQPRPRLPGQLGPVHQW